MSLERSWGRPPREAAPVVRNQTRSAVLLQGSTFLHGRSRLILISTAAAVILGLAGSGMLSSGSSTEPSAPSQPESTTVQATASYSPPVTTNGRATYYLSLPELDGLPPVVSHWTPIELWVAWDPPITDEPSLHKLLENVYIEAVLEPIAPDSPSTIKLSVSRRDVSDLMYADRYGSLSAIIVADS